MKSIWIFLEYFYLN